MERTKLLAIFGTVILLGLFIWLLVSIFGGDDDTQVAFSEALAAQGTIIEISDIAKNNSGDSTTQELAATVTSTTTSDLSRLARHYDAEYGDVPESYAEAVEELENAREDVTGLYLRTAHEYLEFSLARLEQLHGSSQDDEFASDLELAIENQSTHIERLEELSN